MQSPDVPPSWADVDRDLNLLAQALGVQQGPREAQLHAALDELAHSGWDIPTEAEALDWAA